MGPGQKAVGAERRGQQHVTRTEVGLGQVAGTEASGCFGMGLDDDRPAGVVGAGAVEERKEGLARGAAGAQRCIALGLVDDKYVTGRWGAEVGIMGIVFRQVCAANPVHGRACPGQKLRIIKRMGGQQRFKIRWLAGVEMHARPIEQKTDRRFAVATGQDGAEEGILDIQEPTAGPGGDGVSAPCCRAVAPDRDDVVLLRPAGGGSLAGKRHDPSDAA